jgi:hypothetical protein
MISHLDVYVRPTFSDFALLNMLQVFKIMWSEPLGQGGKPKSGRYTVEELPNETNSKLGEKAYHSIRRFVVIKTERGHSLCL